MRKYSVMTAGPMYRTYEVDCTLITENGSYTSFDQDEGTMLMIPTSQILSIEFVPEDEEK